MDDALFIAASSLNAFEKIVENAAQNAVFSDTPGFQRQRAVLQPFSAYLKDAGVRGNLLTSRQTTTFEQGDLVPNGSRTSVGLRGPGFFVIQAPTGEQVFTRNGEFIIDAQNRLTTSGGYPVLNDTLTPITIDPRRGEVKIDKKGLVVQAGRSVGKMQIVEFNDPEREKLQMVGNGMYIADPSYNLRPSETTIAEQGYLELPQFTGPQSMVDIIATQRSHDSVRKAIAAINDAQEQLIRSST